ncbi:MAG TPA: helix-turn-helix domain-containing protein [Brevundimonas sp.]|nr:helix-turn-helix domain-containing protein [Brevundimonas sp.]
MVRDSDDTPNTVLPFPGVADDASPVTEAETLGDGLRIAREQSGRSLAQLSSMTRVPVRYLTAIEQNDFSTLPNRVFSIGYVRSYAEALGLDEQLAVERFKRETPDPTVPLQAPVGVAFEEGRRVSPKLIAAGIALVVAVVGWNVFQRISLMREPQPSDIAAVPESWAAAPTVAGTPLRLSAPQPAPPDQTTPALYVTPGLEAELTGIDPTSPAGLAAAAAAAAPPVQRAFNPRGAIYGAPASASQVVIQARKPGGLVVRMGDNRVLFARQLAAGDAWRAPLGVAATIDASSDFADFDVYLNGEHGGVLTAEQTPLSELNGRAEALARQIAAEAGARAQAAQAAALRAQAAQPAARPAPPPG